MLARTRDMPATESIHSVSLTQSPCFLPCCDKEEWILIKCQGPDSAAVAVAAPGVISPSLTFPENVESFESNNVNKYMCQALYIFV